MHSAAFTRLFGASVAAGLLAMSAGAGAQEIRLTASSSHPPILPWVSTIKDLVVPEANKRLEARGSSFRIRWTEAYAGALYDFNNTLDGIGQGLGDIGWVGSLWEPVKMPLHNVAYYAPFAAYDIWQLLEIQQELEANFAPFKEEWTRHNTVFLGAQVADSYQLMTKKPINRLEDVRGLKLVTAGVVSALTGNTGAVPVDAGLPLFYNHIQTGVADGTIILTTGMIPFKLHEVAPYVTKVNFGAVISGGLAMNADTWKGLPKEVQDLFLELGRDYAQEQTRRVAANEAKGFELLPQQGAKVSEFPEEERKRWAMALPDIAGDWARDLERRGVPAKQLLAAFMDAVRKTGGTPLRDWDR